MKEGFTFNWASINFLRKYTSKNFGGGGGTEKSQVSQHADKNGCRVRNFSIEHSHISKLNHW